MLYYEKIKKMINVIKKAMFLPVKDKKISLPNSARYYNVEHFN